jgi:hypothetical protein
VDLCAAWQAHRSRIAVVLALLLLAPVAVSAQAVPSLLADLKAERAKYGATMTNDDCVALLNAVVWKNKHLGFTLAEKTGGNYGTRRDGQRLSVDGIIWTRDKTFIDALGDAGRASKPAWQVRRVGQINPESGQPFRPFTGRLIQPIDPGTGTPPQPQPTPPATTCDAERAAAAQWQARARTLENLLVDNVAKAKALEAQLQEWDARLKVALEEANGLRQQLAGVTCQGWLPLGMFRVPARCEVVRP